MIKITFYSGTQIYFFSKGVNKDSDLFDRPNEFNPDRFLNDDGKYVRDEHLLLFGYGKRRCVGEKLGRAELFLFFTMLMQKFKFSKVTKEQVLDFTPVPGLVFHPKAFEVLVEEVI